MRLNSYRKDCSSVLSSNISQKIKKTISSTTAGERNVECERQSKCAGKPLDPFSDQALNENCTQQN